MAKTRYDVLVIGGGISGACVAWDAAARGLKVALVDQADFGGATSANSLKTIHGGLRYLQDGNLRLVRRMAEERKALLRIAPHLVHPLPVLMPTFESHLLRSRWMLGAAARVNDLISLDRNWGQPPAQFLPGSHVLSRSACLSMLPALAPTPVSGGLVWHDAQVYNTERLTLAFLQSAVDAGAQVANYVRSTALVRVGGRVTGALVRDALTGASLTLAARMIVNTAGPWIDEVLQTLGGMAAAPHFVPSLAVNLVTRQLWPDYAVGLPSSFVAPGPGGAPVPHTQTLFIAPWRGYSLVGTRHVVVPAAGQPTLVTDELVRNILDQANRAYPALGLRREDVYWVHTGLLPVVPGQATSTEANLRRESRVYDHGKPDGLDGLVTVVGVKYTTARITAERAVDLVCQKLKQPTSRSRTRVLPLYGGQPAANAGQPVPSERHISAASHRALRFNHGSACHQVLRYVEQDPSWGKPVDGHTTVMRGEVIHAVRAEMACLLSDVVLRRTDLGSAGPPDARAVEACAEIMAAELDWDRPRLQHELNEVWSYYASRPTCGAPVELPV